MMKILIVEDNENSRILLESALGLNGYEVESAENGKIALELAVHKPPDLIISDILMPEMDGYALCQAVKADETLCEIPFVFYTATYTEPGDEKLAMDLGAAKFIVKPMEIDAFLKEIRAVLDVRKSGKLSSPRKTYKDPCEFQKDHATVLAKKLDKKIQQLEEEKERLTKSEEKYRRLVEALRDDYFFYTYDTNGVFTYISPSIRKVLGYTQEEFLVHFTKYLTENPINKKVVRYAEKGLRGIKQLPYDIEIFHKNGSIHRLQVTEEPVSGKDGDVVAVEGIAHDITKRLEMEKQLAKTQEWLQQVQKMESIGTLAGGIAHDFNNMLGIITGNVSYALSLVNKDSKLSEVLSDVQKGAEQAQTLTQQLLTFARGGEPIKKAVNLNLIIEESALLVTSGTQTRCKFDLADDLWTVEADKGQINQTIGNLVINANQAMPDGGEIYIKSENCEIESMFGIPLTPGRYVRIHIQDHGIGILDENLLRIFDPYFTTKPKGNGLGLSTVYSIIKRHGGYITVNSKEAKGTSFYLYLPATLGDYDIAEDMEKTLHQGCGSVLVMDDQELIREMVGRMLNEMGYDAVLVKDGVQAIELYREAYPSQKPFDVVILDLTVPGGMGGVKAISELLKIDPKVKAIVSSGYSNDPIMANYEDYGFCGVVPKPYSISQLAESLNKIIGKED